MSKLEKEAQGEAAARKTPPRVDPPDRARALRVGISACLLGENVRFDGGHKKDPFLTNVLARYVEWVPVCPELEMGLGVPRESIRLVGPREAPRLVAIQSGTDHTEGMRRFAEKRMRELEAMNLCGYVLKKDSPSCGMERVRVYGERGAPARAGSGLFARALMRHFPRLPVEEEGGLYDAARRENFIERIFAYGRWQSLSQDRWSLGALAAFHSAHKFLLLAHSSKHYQRLERLVARAKNKTPAEIRRLYGDLFMQALKVKATVRQNVHVLHQIIGLFKEQLAADEKQELLELIEHYRGARVPRLAPITRIKHYVAKYGVLYMANQAYLNPYPKELVRRLPCD